MTDRQTVIGQYEDLLQRYEAAVLDSSEATEPSVNDKITVDSLDQLMELVRGSEVCTCHCGFLSEEQIHTHAIRCSRPMCIGFQLVPLNGCNGFILSHHLTSNMFYSIQYNTNVGLL